MDIAKGFFQVDRETFIAELATHPTRNHLYQTLLAIADFRDGIVRCSYLELGRRANLTRKQVRVSIASLVHSKSVGVLPTKLRNAKTQIIINGYHRWTKHNGMGQQKGQQTIGASMSKDEEKIGTQIDMGQQTGQQTECSYLEDKNKKINSNLVTFPKVTDKTVGKMPKVQKRIRVWPHAKEAVELWLIYKAFLGEVYPELEFEYKGRIIGTCNTIINEMGFDKAVERATALWCFTDNQKNRYYRSRRHEISLILEKAIPLDIDHSRLTGDKVDVVLYNQLQEVIEIGRNRLQAKKVESETVEGNS